MTGPRVILTVVDLNCPFGLGGSSRVNGDETRIDTVWPEYGASA